MITVPTAPVHDTTMSTPAMASREAVERDRRAVDRGGELFSADIGPVGDDDLPHAVPAESRSAQGAHAARAHDERAAAGQPVERRRGEIESDTYERGANAVDARLRVRALAHPQRLLEELVEHPPGSAAVLSGAQGRTELAEDLRLADDHGVQAAGDGEQVVDGAVLVVDVEVRSQLVDGDAGVPRQQLRGIEERGVEALHAQVELDPVAGGERDDLVDVRRARDIEGQLGDAIRVECDSLEQGDRSGAVADADDQDAHRVPARASWRSGRSARAAPGTGATSTLRCSWKARICSSIARSTLRTSTSSGTTSTSGAKLRMLPTPAATSRSHTSWAAVAGVAITPIAGPSPADQPLELRHVADGETSDDLADASRVGVEQGGDVEAARREPAVVGERVAEVADADDDDRPILGEAELAGDLVHEVVDVVADAAGAVRTEVGQVLTQLRRTDAGGGRQVLGGDGGDAGVLQRG